MRAILYAALTAVFLYLPATAQMPQPAGRVVAACIDLDSASIMTERLARGPEALPPGMGPTHGTTCKVIPPFIVERKEAEQFDVVIGPAADWEGDRFAVYAVPQKDSGVLAYLFVYLVEGYTPIGWRV